MHVKEREVGRDVICKKIFKLYYLSVLSDTAKKMQKM